MCGKNSIPHKEIILTTDFNPYAPPRAAVEKETPYGCWREGKLLVLRIGSVLPHRCVKCNQPAIEPIKTRKVYWHHPAWYILFFLSIPIYVIVALIARKKAQLAPGLCAAHQKRRRIFLAIGWGGFALGMALLFIGIAQNESGWTLLGIATFLLSAIAGIVGARIVFPARITPEQVRLRGCGKDFLDSLPQQDF